MTDYTPEQLRALAGSFKYPGNRTSIVLRAVADQLEAAAKQPVVAIRYKFPGDLQWQYTESVSNTSPGTVVERLSVTPS